MNPHEKDPVIAMISIIRRIRYQRRFLYERGLSIRVAISITSAVKSSDGPLLWLGEIQCYGRSIRCHAKKLFFSAGYNISTFIYVKEKCQVQEYLISDTMQKIVHIKNRSSYALD